MKISNREVRKLEGLLYCKRKKLDNLVAKSGNARYRNPKKIKIAPQIARLQKEVIKLEGHLLRISTPDSRVKHPRHSI